MPKSPAFAVIFDFDGIILDSETPEYESHRQVYEACGVTLTIEQWQDGIGRITRDEDRFAELCARAERPPADLPTFKSETRRVFNALLRMEAMQGVQSLIEALATERIPLAIASAASARWILRATEGIGVRDLFTAIVTGDDVERRKPAPDVYLEAARRLNVAAARCIAIEDSCHGLAAAKAAGMRAVAIPHWLTAGHDLSAADLRVAHAGELSVAALRRLAVGAPHEAPAPGTPGRDAGRS